jgi:DNA end-binding protein Ku
LLRETLRSTGRVAVAQVVIRTAQHLAVVVPVGKILMLNTLRYADELRPTKDFALPEEGLKGAHVTSKEVDLAKRLIDDMTEHWKADEFKDTYHQDLMRRIEEKIKKGETREITEPDADETKTPRSAQVIDLAALLKQSLDKGGLRRKAADPRRSPKPEASGKTALRVVASARGSAKAPAKRKRA